jgi:predicted dehydrogenase
VSDRTRVRVGLIGRGLAGRVFHTPLIEATPGLELVATAGRDGLDALWAARPDVVVVATPDPTHAELALLALDRGAAVVVDKPLATSVADAERLVAAGAGRLTVFQNRRWDGDFLTLRRVLPELGPVTRYESRFEKLRPVVADGWREAPGAGHLVDLGAHLVDQALVLFGPARSVYAELDARRPGAQVEDDAFVALEHDGGVRAHLWMSATAPLAGPRFRVSGLRAGFATDGLDVQEPQLAGGMSPDDPAFGVRPPLDRGRYRDFYAAVPAWARGEAPAPVDPADAVAALRVLEAARRSAAERRVVTL